MKADTKTGFDVVALNGVYENQPLIGVPTVKWL
jgi:hypothetical protein